MILKEKAFAGIHDILYEIISHMRISTYVAYSIGPFYLQMAEMGQSTSIIQILQLHG